MTPVEIHFRLTIIRERIAAIGEELNTISQSVQQHGALQLLETASAGLEEVGRQLRSVATLEDTQAMLCLSLQATSLKRAEVLSFPTELEKPARRSL